MADEKALTPVHQSLAELRAIAKRAKSRHDPELRRATPEEIALAESQRKPHHCVAHSSRTGLPCRGTRVMGATVCPKHGGNLKRVKAKAQARLTEALMPVLNSLIKVATEGENENARVKASTDLLDRAEIGALVKAKVRASKKEKADTSGKVVVNIGFMSNGTTPKVIEAKVVKSDEE
jgi:hypothetical protein